MKNLFTQVMLLAALSSPLQAQLVQESDDFSGWIAKERIEYGFVRANGGESFSEGVPPHSFWGSLSLNRSLVCGEVDLLCMAADQVFDPGGLYEIRNIKFQLDVKPEALNGSPSCLKFFPVIWQDGVTYVAPAHDFPGITPGIWQTVNYSTVPNASEFEKIFIGLRSTWAHPDFSVHGGPIAFGFYIFASSGIIFRYDYYVDNFQATFDVDLPRLDLSQSPLQRSQSSTLTLERAQPDETAYFFLSRAGLGMGSCFPRFGGLCLDILEPMTFLGEAQTNAAGVATLVGTIPAWAPLMTVHTQAMIRRGVGGAESLASNTVSATILP